MFHWKTNLCFYCKKADSAASLCNKYQQGDHGNSRKCDASSVFILLMLKLEY